MGVTIVSSFVRASIQGARTNNFLVEEQGKGHSVDSQTTVCFDVDDLRAVVADVGLHAFMDDMIARLRQGYEAFEPSQVQNETRSGFSYNQPELGLVEWMPTMTLGDVVSVKTVAYHPENPTRRNLPSVLATTALYNTETGRLDAICEATLLTALRTGATSAVMTDRLTHDRPITLGVVGCGAQAVTQIHAISRVRPIERLIVTDANESNAKSLGSRLPSEVTEPEPVSVIEFAELIRTLDVLCTCTSVDPGDGPVIELEGAKPHLHVNAVGSDFPGKVELPVDYLRTSVVVPDLLDQCLVEGESQQLEPSELGPGMIDVLTDPAHIELASQRTVFDSTGWGYADQLAAQLFIEHATRLGLGTPVQLQHRPADPFDPYETLDSRA